jgi:hypothetical protein
MREKYKIGHGGTETRSRELKKNRKLAQRHGEDEVRKKTKK